jgi:hypothetical protein
MRNRALIDCPYCNQEIHSFQALGNHIHHRHPEKPKVKCLLKVACSNCGEIIEKPPSHIRIHNFCSVDCCLSWLHREKPWDEDKRTQRLSLSLSKAYGEGRKSPPNPRGSHLSPVTINKMLGRCPWNKGSTKDTDTRIKAYAKKLKGRQIPSGVVEKDRQAMLAYWRDSEYVSKQMRARRLKPNKAELGLLSLLEVFGFEYVGDGLRKDFIIGGKCPDYSNNDHKLIELFGDYWHRDEDPQDKIDHYKKYGFDSLIIWERELKDKQVVLAKVKQFIKGGSKCK